MKRAPWLPEPMDTGAETPVLGTGCGLGVVALVALVGAIFAAGAWRTRLGGFLEDTRAVTALSLASVVLVATLPLLERLGPRASSARSGTRLGAAFFGGVIGLGAAILLGHPIIHRGLCSFGIGHDDPGVMAGPFLALVLAIGGGLGAVILGWVCEPLLTGERGARWRVAFLRRSAWAAWTAVAGLVLLSVVARARRPDPTLAGYLASLPEIGRAPEMERPRTGSGWVDVDVDAGRLTVTRTGARIAVERRGAPSVGPDGRDERSALVFGEDAFEVRRDAAHGLILVEIAHAHGWGVHHGVMNGRAAFREADLVPVDLHVADLHDLTGPPVPWILAAAFGLLVALGAMVHRRALLRVLARTAQHRAGHADAAGRVTLDEGPVCEPDATGAPAPAGPVVVIPIGAMPAPTYRTAPTLGRVIVVPGTLSEVAAAVRGAQVSRYLLALAALSITAAPIVAAALAGLVAP